MASDIDPTSKKDTPKMAETWSEMFRAWPKQSLFIVVNEISERFSYFGMRTVLTLYILNVLQFNENLASTFFNVFSAFSFFSTILGAIIADGFLGKFKTIFFVSILYAIGQIVLAFVSTRSRGSVLHPWIDFFGLMMISLGTGGIKPCVSPFGADQFEPHEIKMISIYFSVFYFSINAGGMISMFITPLFRTAPCLNQDTCYPLAFGVPAILMIIATVAFMAGSFWYKKKPPKFNVFKAVAVVIKKAIGNKLSSKEERNHWLDHALKHHLCKNNPKCMQRKRRRNDPNACAKAKFVDDVKSLFRVLLMYIPLPIFWALYDQQGSIWTFQSLAMDSRLWGNTLILPDQMQVINAVLIMIFIPVFQAVVYPVCNIFFKFTPLRKMVCGGVLAGVAFLIAAFVQLSVNKTLPILPSTGNSYVSIVNTLEHCSLNVTVVGQNFTAFIPPKQSLQNTHNNITMFELKQKETFDFQFSSSRTNCPSFLNTNQKFTIPADKISYIYVNHVGMFIQSIKPDKSTEGTGGFSMAIITALDIDYDKNFVFCRVTKADKVDMKNVCDKDKKLDYFAYRVKYSIEGEEQTDQIGQVPYVVGNTSMHAGVFKVKTLRPGRWALFYMEGDDKDFAWTGFEFERYKQGGVYALSLTGPKTDPSWMEFNVTPDNGISILWQIPQIVVISAAEILFSITGYEFAYTQAAPSMKSVIGSAYLLTIGIGDMIIVLLI